MALGSHARGELHCASDQDHALLWDTARAAGSSYATDLAAEVITGLTEFGMRPCDGGYMADRWSVGLSDWVTQARHRIDAPTPEAVLDTDVFLDLRGLVGDLDIAPATDVLLGGADSPRLLHGLAVAATSFPTALNAFGRLPHGPVDLKRTGLAPLVLLARLYGLDARSGAVTTRDRLAATAEAGLLSEELIGRLSDGFEVLTRLRLDRPGGPGPSRAPPLGRGCRRGPHRRRPGGPAGVLPRRARSPVGDGREIPDRPVNRPRSNSPGGGS